MARMTMRGSGALPCGENLATMRRGHDSGAFADSVIITIPMSPSHALATGLVSTAPTEASSGRYLRKRSALVSHEVERSASVRGTRNGRRVPSRSPPAEHASRTSWLAVAISMWTASSSTLEMLRRDILSFGDSDRQTLHTSSREHLAVVFARVLRQKRRG